MPVKLLNNTRSLLLCSNFLLEMLDCCYRNHGPASKYTTPSNEIPADQVQCSYNILWKEHSGINEGINREFQQLSHLYLALLTQAEHKGAVGQARERKGLILSTHPQAEMQEDQIKADIRLKGLNIVALVLWSHGFLFFLFQSLVRYRYKGD